MNSTCLRKQLQEELQRLKTKLGSNVRLKKNKEGPNAPFPIILVLVIDKPEAFEHFDVDNLNLCVTVKEHSKRDVPLQEGRTPTKPYFECCIAVTNESLPKSLKNRIALHLETYLRSCGDESNVLGLLCLVDYVRETYGTLLSLIRDLVEPYETVNDNGSSVRRIAVVNDEAKIEITASMEPKADQEDLSVEEQTIKDLLQSDLTYFERVFQHSTLKCTASRKSYVIAQREEKYIMDFLHSCGIGNDLGFPGLKDSILYISLTGFTPTSPDWEHILPKHSGDISLNFHAFIGRKYPQKTAILCRVILADESMFPEEASAMLRTFEKILLSSAFESLQNDIVSIKSIVRYCANHADEALLEALSMWEEAQRLKELKNGPQRSEATETTSGTKYLVNLINLQLEGIDALSLNSLYIEVLCNRCRHRMVLEEHSLGSRWTCIRAPCEKCHATISISIYPKIVHESCNVICIVGCNGCLPLDLLPMCTLEVQCQCSQLGIIDSQLNQGRWNQKTCRNCHIHNNAFFFERVCFSELKKYQSSKGPKTGSAIPSQPSACEYSAYDRDYQLLLGQPLPDTGTCSHYHHSHRWLRFPCCGRRYPCDVCHEQLTDGHLMKIATRMVCGFCSLEQSLGNKCSSCGKKLTTSGSRPEGRNTCYWEGGKGQRNKKRLSRKDPHKFRNSKAKTVSKKAFAKSKKPSES